MGITATKPYIIDEFESDDEVDVQYENAIETLSDYTFSNQANIDANINGRDPSEGNVRIHVNEEAFKVKEETFIYSDNYVNGLEELLKLLEIHDFEGAQKVADFLRTSQGFSTNCASAIGSHEDEISVSLPLSVASYVSTTVTSTWPSRTPREISEKLSYSSQQQNGASEDLSDDDERKALAQLDLELSQFEDIEQKISNEEPVFHSGIPRLKSATQRSGRNTGNNSDVIRRTHSERRSPSPHSPSGKLRSGIPRYSWAHVVPSVSSAFSTESKVDEQTLDASCMSSTLESLLEISDRAQIGASKKISDKPFAVDSTGCTLNSSYSSVVPDEETGDTRTSEINISDLTGRVKMKKKHSGLPSSWTSVGDPQKVVKIPVLGDYEPGISSSVSSEMATEEIAACRTIGECGDPSEKKVLDLKRWYCISRPQYKTSCGISAVVSCWNYLFSTMGHGSLKPVTQEAAMKLLGFASPFDRIDFGPITGNMTLLKWFNELSSHFKVIGKCFIMYKPSGKNQTVGMTDQMALKALKKGLKGSNTAFIYHCYNHYFCPIGYEDTSQFCVDAYKGNVGEDVETWVLIGDTNRKYSSIHCKSWEQICLDLNCKYPNYFNIRKNWLGVMQQDKTTTAGENLHCIMAFKKVTENLQSSSTLVSSSNSSVSLLEARSSRLPVRPNNASTSPTRSAPGIRSAVDTYRPELTNDVHTSLGEDEILSTLYAPIMRLHHGYRNPPVRLRRLNSSPLWVFPSPKEEDEYCISESDETQNEDLEYSEIDKDSNTEEEHKDSTFDDDSEF